MSGVGKGEDADLGFFQEDLEQIKEARLSGIVALGKGLDSKTAPYEVK